MIILAILIIIGTIISIVGGRRLRAQEKALDDFMEKERKANNVRKQSIDDLDYVKVPLEFIPSSLLANDEEVADCIHTLKELSEKKILNLTGISNTDLKLTYGTANISILSECDENYTIYARTMQRLAELYDKNGYESNARIILEKVIESRTDIIASYGLLADIYKRHNEEDKLKALADMTDELTDLASDRAKEAVRKVMKGN